MYQTIKLNVFNFANCTKIMNILLTFNNFKIVYVNLTQFNFDDEPKFDMHQFEKYKKFLNGYLEENIFLKKILVFSENKIHCGDMTFPNKNDKQLFFTFFHALLILDNDIFDGDLTKWSCNKKRIVFIFEKICSERACLWWEDFPMEMILHKNTILMLFFLYFRYSRQVGINCFSKDCHAVENQNKRHLILNKNIGIWYEKHGFYNKSFFGKYKKICVKEILTLHHNFKNLEKENIFVQKMLKCQNFKYDFLKTIKKDTKYRFYEFIRRFLDCLIKSFESLFLSSNYKWACKGRISEDFISSKDIFISFLNKNCFAISYVSTYDEKIHSVTNYTCNFDKYFVKLSFLILSYVYKFQTNKVSNFSKKTNMQHGMQIDDYIVSLGIISKLLENKCLMENIFLCYFKLKKVLNLKKLAISVSKHTKITFDSKIKAICIVLEICNKVRKLSNNCNFVRYLLVYDKMQAVQKLNCSISSDEKDNFVNFGPIWIDFLRNSQGATNHFEKVIACQAGKTMQFVCQAAIEKGVQKLLTDLKLTVSKEVVQKLLIVLRLAISMKNEQKWSSFETFDRVSTVIVTISVTKSKKYGDPITSNNLQAELLDSITKMINLRSCIQNTSKMASLHTDLQCQLMQIKIKVASNKLKSFVAFNLVFLLVTCIYTKKLILYQMLI